MNDLEKLNNVLGAINALEPIVGSLISSLRNPGETDDEVIARAKAFVAETRQITTADQGDQ